MTTESPTSSELAAHHRRFRRDIGYFNSIWPQVRKKYPDQYVAVYEEQVVANHGTLKKVLATPDDRGFPKNHTVIRFASKKPRRMIL